MIVLKFSLRIKIAFVLLMMLFMANIDLQGTTLSVRGKNKNMTVKNSGEKTAISHVNWEKVVGKKNFTEHFKEKKFKPRKAWNFNLGGFGFLFRTLLYIGTVLLLAILLFIVLKYVLKFYDERAKSDEGGISFENLDENIHETDLERFLRIAKEEGNWAQCIRVYYLMVVKALSDSGLIDWKKDKTNHSYVMEMAPKKGGPKFLQLTNVYEHVWFGELRLDSIRFQHIEGIFDEYLLIISKGEA